MDPVQNINDFAFRAGMTKEKEVPANNKEFAFYSFPNVHNVKHLSVEQIRSKYKEYLEKENFYYVLKNKGVIHLKFCISKLELMPVIDEKYNELSCILEKCVEDYLNGDNIDI